MIPVFLKIKPMNIRWRIIFFIFLPLLAEAQTELTQKDLKKLSLEELMNIEVISVSKRSERLVETPSAIQVITSDDISKYGATNIPEALYLAGNLQVAQKSSHAWGISARGFNTDLANKMLVLMDGRTLYTPLYSGVFWERQDYLLNDINQIEVISGPGGTLWGANAVNGVISITTKNAKNTQGLFGEVAGGNEVQGLTNLRYGGKIAKNIYYRVYGKYSQKDGAVYADSANAHDSWHMAQTGFRIDAEPGSRSKLTLQGDFYNNTADLLPGGISTVIGDNILGRWTRTFADSSEMRLQAYYDHTNLDGPTAAFVANGLTLAPAGVFKDDLSTYDIDLQHQFKAGKLNRIVWGLGYRFTHDEVSNAPALGFLPSLLDQNLFNVFVQDELSLLKNVRLTLGTKLEHNAYVGWFAEPNGRLRWIINDKNMIWGAVSRAVRTPSRIDRNLTQGTPPYFVLLTGGQNFASESVIASEVGYRGQLGTQATISISTYYNQYYDIRSTVLNPVTIFPLSFQNGLEGNTYGVEFSLTYQVSDWWQLFSSYNVLREDIKIRQGETDFNNAHNETADPGWQFTFRSTFYLPGKISISPAFRAVDQLPINASGVLKTVPSYADMDGRIAWQMSENIEISIAGRNLFHDQHVEYGAPGPAREGRPEKCVCKARGKILTCVYYHFLPLDRVIDVVVL